MTKSSPIFAAATVAVNWACGLVAIIARRDAAFIGQCAAVACCLNAFGGLFWVMWLVVRHAPSRQRRDVEILIDWESRNVSTITDPDVRVFLHEKSHDQPQPPTNPKETP